MSKDEIDIFDINYLGRTNLCPSDLIRLNSQINELEILLNDLTRNRKENSKQIRRVCNVLLDISVLAKSAGDRYRKKNLHLRISR